MPITYEGICDKLGFDLKDYDEYHKKHKAVGSDATGSVFQKLTLEEMDFLEENGYIG